MFMVYVNKYNEVYQGTLSCEGTMVASLLQNNYIQSQVPTDPADPELNPLFTGFFSHRFPVLRRCKARHFLEYVIKRRE